MSITPQTLIAAALDHHRAGRLADAEALYRKALEQQPDNADALHLLGMTAFQSGRNAEATAFIEKAIALHPTAASYHANLGNVLQAEGRLEEAEASYRRALALRPQQPEVHLNLGHILKALSDVDAALASYRQAITLNPDLAEAHAAEATALLLNADYAAGWDRFDWRWQTRAYLDAQRSYPFPQWQGERIDGKLLIWGEQGIGDEIMFAGMVPDAVAVGIPCVLDCAPRLQPLFARSFPQVEVLSGIDVDQANARGIAAHIPAGSLPRLFRRSPQAFAKTQSSYLKADPNEASQFRLRYAGKRSIGIAWHTSNAQSGRSRSIALSQLRPLFALPGIQWVSLQYGDHDALEAQAAATSAPILIDRTVDQLADIDLFAAQVAAMDLVITIDNSTAHLAAALGVETWLMLPCAPDWRWLRGGDRSPWYPVMRLFRQSARADWRPPVGEVEIALRAWLHLGQSLLASGSQGSTGAVPPSGAVSGT